MQITVNENFINQIDLYSNYVAYKLKVEVEKNKVIPINDIILGTNFIIYCVAKEMKLSSAKIFLKKLEKEINSGLLNIIKLGTYSDDNVYEFSFKEHNDEFYLKRFHEILDEDQNIKKTYFYNLGCSIVEEMGNSRTILVEKWVKEYPEGFSFLLTEILEKLFSWEISADDFKKITREFKFRFNWMKKEVLHFFKSKEEVEYER